MRKRDERVIKKVVDKIIDSEVLLTGDGDFFVETLRNEIHTIIIRNLFSKESSIDAIQINVGGSSFGYKNGEYQEMLIASYQLVLHGKKRQDPVYSTEFYSTREVAIWQNLPHSSGW